MPRQQKELDYPVSQIIEGAYSYLNDNSDVQKVDGADHAETVPSNHTDWRRDISQYNQEMLELQKSHPNLVKRFKLPYSTTEGRDVYGVEITDNVNEYTGKPVFTIVGMHHGDEPESGENAMEFAYDLAQPDTSINALKDVPSLLKKVRVIIVPVLNVDGFMSKKRTTGNNTDVNRNFGLGWQIGTQSSSTGSAPFSEPEARNLRDLITSHQTETFFTLHTCGQTILYPPLERRAGGTPDETLFGSFSALAKEMSLQSGYTPMVSGDDYETTGESPDWSYYATRGLGFTIEISKCDIPRNQRFNQEHYKSHAVDSYLGTGSAPAPGGIRGTLMTGLKYTSENPNDGKIVGNAPKGALLELHKSFNLWTSPNPYRNGGPPEAVPTDLSSKLIPVKSGEFTWAVNPSVRPTPGYQEHGVYQNHAGFENESWSLTCAQSDGTVLQEIQVTVDRGETVKVDLQQCLDKFVPSPNDVESANDIKKLVNDYKKKGAFKNESAVHAIDLHLTGISLYENEEKDSKVVKQLNNFKILLDQQQKNQLISDDAYQSLNQAAGTLKEIWQ